VDLGAPPSPAADSPAVREALAHIAERASHHGVCPAIFTSGREAAVRLVGEGYRMLTVGSDRLLMAEASRSLLGSIRSSL
jgi:2-keto-3-deoxy-L-rhamnonate aldolase RhmA